MTNQTTRRFTPPNPPRLTWLVIAFDDASLVTEIEAVTPDPVFVRRLLKLSPNVPIIIGRP